MRCVSCLSLVALYGPAACVTWISCTDQTNGKIVAAPLRSAHSHDAILVLDATR